MIEIKELNKDLIHRANSNSFGGTRGNNSNAGYMDSAETIMSWKISDEKKQELLNKLYSKWSEVLSLEAQHVSVMVAGPSNYNAKKLDKGDRILEKSSELYDWFKKLEEQVNSKANDKVETAIRMINFCVNSHWGADPGPHMLELAKYDNAKFIEFFEKLNPKYNWRKNSNVFKTYEKSISGDFKEVKKEIFFEDANFKAYIEGERAYINFILAPKRQLIVALKSRGWWWNAYEKAWSTYLAKLDKEWVASISERYSQYL